MRKIALICGMITALSPSLAMGADKVVFGYLENIHVFPGRFSMEAKLDTGADHSSMHARILKRERKNGQDWILFEVGNKSGATVQFNKPVERIAKVRRHFGKVQERPVVMIEICIGTIRKNVQVNLVDRKKFSFKVLIGRSFLKEAALVDAGLKFTSEPKCG